MAPAARTTSISSRLDDEASPSVNCSAMRLHCVEGAGNPRRPGRVALEHPLDHDPVDLLRRLGEADPVVHVARPLGRAHPHHVPLRAVVPAPASLPGELLAHLVPHLLGVDEHPVHVEDDRLGHSAQVPAVDVDERSLAGPRLEPLDRRRRRSRGRRRGSRSTRAGDHPADRPLEQPRVVARAPAIPSHCTSGGTLRAKCCARCAWSPARIETHHSSASSSTSKSDADRPSEIETSGGESDTDTSDETVSPALRARPTRRRPPTRPPASAGRAPAALARPSASPLTAEP